MDYQWRITGTVNRVGFDDNLYELMAITRDMDLDKFITFVDTKRGVRDPRELPHMAAAVDRIHRAVTAGERITVCGDYDVDGVTATACMVLGLNQLGAHVDWLVPDRMKDGYGLSERMVDVCAANQTNLLVTVDNGVAAWKGIAKAKSMGMDVVVTDHHPVRSVTLPTDIVVDPFVDKLYPFPGICGCMVAYKLLRVLIPDLTSRRVNNELVGLTTIATVADAMDLVDENRVFVYNGLKTLAHTGNRGLTQLLEQLRLTNKNITSTDIGFSIAPCLNAAGRMGSADTCVKLFLGDDDVEAARIAEKLIAANERRKALQREALASIVVDDADPVIVQDFPTAPGGMLGVIAGQVANKYQRPCFAVRLVGDHYGGSGRSFGGFDIGACVAGNQDIATGGGHAGACGVSIQADKLDEFRMRCAKAYAEYVASADVDTVDSPTVDVTGVLPLRFADMDLVERVMNVAPFGHGNPEPVFAALNVELRDPEVIGKLQNTVRGQLVDADGAALSIVCFNAVKDKLVDELHLPPRVDALFTIGVNEWAGRRTVQAILTDVRLPSDNT